MKTSKERQVEKAEAITKLREMLQPQTQLYTILRRVSSSGMSRLISVVAIKDGQSIINLDYWIARALDFRINPDKGGLKVSGCGMDMGFHVVHTLSQVLYGKGGQLSHEWL